MKQAIDYSQYNSNQLILLAQTGDADAMRELTIVNTPLVKAMAKRFNNFTTERDDLLQIGYIGLVKAIKGFDPSYNVKFSTYAVPLIVGEIKRYIRDEGSVKVARSIKELRQKIRGFCDEYRNKNGIEPSINEICREMQCKADHVLEAIESGYTTVSLEQTVSGDDNSNECLINKLQHKKDTDWLDIIQLKQSLRELTDMEKRIISLRYYSNFTQAVIAELLGMSQVQISRMESRILKKLRCKMK